jgi:hypothetical protein
MKKITIIIEDEPEAIPFPMYNRNISACDGCPNNPKNGGSGVCWCTIPLINNPTHTWPGYSTTTGVSSVTG